MHQKHPPAKTAVLACDGAEFCAAATTAIENDRAVSNIGFIESLILYLGRHVERSRDTPTELSESSLRNGCACHCKSGVKFATANPSFGGPPHSKARYPARQLRKSCDLKHAWNR